MSRQSKTQKNDEFERVFERLLDLNEPTAEYLSKHLMDRCRNRRSPLNYKEMHDVSGMDMFDIKDILFKFSSRGLRLLCRPFPEAYADRANIHPDNMPFPGVYFGSFLDKDDKGFKIRDVIRLASVLKDTVKLGRVLKPCKVPPTSGLLKDAKRIGDYWEEYMKDQGVWTDVEEFMGNVGEVFPSEIPARLKDVKYDGYTDLSPCYVGYSRGMDRRFDQHQAGLPPSPREISSAKSPPINFHLRLTKLVPVRGSISSVIQLLAVVISKMIGCDYTWKPVIVWTSWDGHHMQGRVRPRNPADLFNPADLLIIVGRDGDCRVDKPQKRGLGVARGV
jgi:hypothetical protein